MFDGKNGCDCKDNTCSNCYVLKFSEIVLPDTLNLLKHICTTTNWTIGKFTLSISLFFLGAERLKMLTLLWGVSVWCAILWADSARKSWLASKILRYSLKPKMAHWWHVGTQTLVWHTLKFPVIEECLLFYLGGRLAPNGLHSCPIA